jgi:hypothetical protein
MSHLLEQLATRSSSTTSPISFERVGGGHWKEWDRFLTLDGKPAYQIGNVCNTCAFFFKRLEGAVRSVKLESLEAALTSGISTLDQATADDLVRILPAGDYQAWFMSCRPSVVRPGASNDYFCHEQVDLFGVDPFWDLPHDPRTEYYRLETAAVAPGRMLFEFLVPMYPGRWLKDEVMRKYRSAFATGSKPTALAISILDVKGPADVEGSDREHLCLTHYLLDGHHKARAAADGGHALGLVSFLAIDQGLSTHEDRTAVLAALGETAS